MLSDSVEESCHRGGISASNSSGVTGAEFLRCGTSTEEGVEARQMSKEVFD